VSATVELPGAEGGPETEEERQHWKVDGLGTATWAMERVQELARRQKEIELLTEERVERLQAWAAEQVDALQRDREFFEGHLKGYALSLRREDPRRKSVSTPFGRVATREPAVRWEIHGDDLALEWARKHRPDLIRTVESVPLADLKGVLEVTDEGVVDPELGEVLPWVTAQRGDLTAKVVVDL
jgi:hypothetical protein